MYDVYDYAVISRDGYSIYVSCGFTESDCRVEVDVFEKDYNYAEIFGSMSEAWQRFCELEKAYENGLEIDF